jgi:hypothetical protein
LRAAPGHALSTNQQAQANIAIRTHSTGKGAAHHNTLHTFSNRSDRSNAAEEERSPAKAAAAPAYYSTYFYHTSSFGPSTALGSATCPVFLHPVTWKEHPLPDAVGRLRLAVKVTTPREVPLVPVLLLTVIGHPRRQHGPPRASHRHAPYPGASGAQHNRDGGLAGHLHHRKQAQHGS